ncbi:amino acid transporter [Polychaeton citri CBS 116435]|uniref:Amino acid transporter n=1 Tax=Polychaeton citri CBS 116435 TaxID=1314669 RepID=A0A9P4Q759_9PEZI|nr:amino acid transporter [Polychaeton citri CBS 116435]
MAEKIPSTLYAQEVGLHASASNSEDDVVVVTDHKGTEADQMDMYRMGKKQQMKRIFKLWPMFGFSMILTSSWEGLLGANTIALYNGGVSGAIYMYIICWIGFLAVYASMAEMASMAPTSGGQYHWVSEFAPAKYQRILSYAVGWASVLGWQIAVVATAFQAGTQIQGLLVLNYPSYAFERWHGTLLVIAVVVWDVIFTTIFHKRLPVIEVALLVFHTIGFFCVLIPLLVLGDKATHKQVWGTFFDSGWGSYGTSSLVGILAGVIPLLGADAAAHMSEELQDASKMVPRCMLWSTFSNGLLGLVMLIVYSYCIGNNFLGVTETKTGYAYIQVFYNATHSYAGANAMASIIIIVLIFCSTSILTATSRQLFAFARDGGFPFGKTLAKINPRLKLPLNSIAFSFVFSACISLINIGSTIAFNIINSVGTAALMFSYIICISCLVWCKITNKHLPPAKFYMRGTVGIMVNVVSLGFLLVVFVFSFFPPVPVGRGLSVVNMNWACLLFGAVAIGSVSYYLARGKGRYIGPVKRVQRLE